MINELQWYGARTWTFCADRGRHVSRRGSKEGFDGTVLCVVWA